MSDKSIDRRTLLRAAAAAPLAGGLAACATTPTSDDADRRADGLVAQMTLDEKILLVQSHIFLPPPMAAMLPNQSRMAQPADALQTAGYTAGIERLGIPPLNESDAGLGIGRAFAEVGARNTTALPATILTASTWNAEFARAAGGVIGKEARANGIAVMLAGGCNLTRDPRCGRTFEYFGEDPLLAGRMAGASVQGIQGERVISTVKHFALNAQESARDFIDEQIDQAALRESDLLAFQIAIETGAPGSVMTAYNKVNGTYCSEHPWLLTEVLKNDWRYPGYVMSDWGNVHSTREAALAGLDQQSGQEIDRSPHFGAPLKELAQSDPAVAAKLDDKVRRILRSVIAAGVFDDPPRPGGAIDLPTHAAIAQSAAEEGIVLLKNDGLLPLATSVGKIALIGEKADVGVLSGGGSSQTAPPGSIATPVPNSPIPLPRIDHPSSPLRAIRAQAPNADVRFHDGADHATAAALAAQCDVAIVIARRWDTEGRDAHDLSLPDNQDALISAVAAANRRTIVVLTTGGPVTAPWLDQAGALLAAWYPGIRGAEALAGILFGAVNPSGRLAVTFPKRIDDLPRPHIAGSDLNLGPMPALTGTAPPGLAAQMNEGADVGYRWHEKQRSDLLFPFGFGLSYTSFAISDLIIDDGRDLVVGCIVRNTGQRAGKHVVQIYARPPHTGATRRLIGFAKIELAPNEAKQVTIMAERRLLASFDVDANAWRIAGGAFEITAGASSADIAEAQTITLRPRTIRA